jgi:hypothetical protein
VIPKLLEAEELDVPTSQMMIGSGAKAGRHQHPNSGIDC